MQENIEPWRELIPHSHKEGLRALDRLAKRDLPRFNAVCHELLKDSSLAVRKAALRIVGQFGVADDEEVEAAALAALAVPELREWTALALRKVGSPASFEMLVAYAESGSPAALRIAYTKAQTPEQQRRVLDLAEQFVLSPHFPLRYSAVRVVLPTLSAREKENLLVDIVRRYLDEEALGMLANASARVLPALRDLLSVTEPDTAEHEDVLRAIEKIESRTTATEDD